MLRATGHTLKVWSCASVDGRGELRRVAQKASQRHDFERAESTQNCGWSSPRHSGRNLARFALSGRDMDSSRRHGQLPRAFLEGHPHSSTSAVSRPLGGLVAVRSCEGVDVRRADHGHDGRNDRSHHCGQCGAKIAFARAPRVSRQHLRRCARCSPQACGSTAAVGRKAFSDVKKPFYTAYDHMLGLTCQRLGSIGQTGTTVHRDGSMASADRPSRPSGPRIGEDGLGEESS